MDFLAEAESVLMVFVNYTSCMINALPSPTVRRDVMAFLDDLYS